MKLTEFKRSKLNGDPETCYKFVLLMRNSQEFIPWEGWGWQKGWEYANSGGQYCPKSWLKEK